MQWLPRIADATMDGAQYQTNDLARLLLGDAYVRLYEDMVSYPPPKSVPEDQHETYREVVLDKASILLTKAHARYDEGVRVATRTQWVGSVTDRLRVARDALAAQLAGDPVVAP